MLIHMYACTYKYTHRSTHMQYDVYMYCLSVFGSYLFGGRGKGRGGEGAHICMHVCIYRYVVMHLHQHDAPNAAVRC